MLLSLKVVIKTTSISMKTENVVDRKFNFIVDHVHSSLLLTVGFVRCCFVDDLKSCLFFCTNSRIRNFSVSWYVGARSESLTKNFVIRFLSLQCFGCKQLQVCFFRFFGPPQLFLVLLRHQFERHWISKRYIDWRVCSDLHSSVLETAFRC